MSETVIYKICAREEWESALEAGRYEGSRDDKRDGFVHLSTRAQIEGTVSKHFAGQRDLVLLEVDVYALPPKCLAWEEARGGELFPHLYAELPVEAVRRVTPVEAGPRTGPPL